MCRGRRERSLAVRISPAVARPRLLLAFARQNLGSYRHGHGNARSSSSDSGSLDTSLHDLHFAMADTASGDSLRSPASQDGGGGLGPSLLPPRPPRLHPFEAALGSRYADRGDGKRLYLVYNGRHSLGVAFVCLSVVDAAAPEVRNAVFAAADHDVQPPWQGAAPPDDAADDAADADDAAADAAAAAAADDDDDDDDPRLRHVTRNTKSAHTGSFHACRRGVPGMRTSRSPA